MQRSRDMLIAAPVAGIQLTSNASPLIIDALEEKGLRLQIVMSHEGTDVVRFVTTLRLICGASVLEVEVQFLPFVVIFEWKLSGSTSVSS